MRPYTGVGGTACAQTLAYLLIVGLFLGLPIVLFATIFAMGLQVTQTVAGLRRAPAPSGSANPEAWAALSDDGHPQPEDRR